MRRFSLSFAIGLLCPCGMAMADEPETELKTITVTSTTKTERKLIDAPVSTQVITATQIQDLGAMTIKDVFLNLPGVMVNPGRGELSIRGAGSKGTLLLIDGRRISGETGLIYELDRLPATNIDRIEIVKGPMSVLYGSDALGGIINIITKHPTEGIEGSLDLNAGSNFSGKGQRKGFDADVRGKHERTSFSAWLSAFKTGEYTENEITNTRVPKGGRGGQSAPSQSNLGLLPNGSTCQRTQGQCATKSQPIGSRIADHYDLSTTYRQAGDVINLGGTLNQEINDSFRLGLDLAYLRESKTGRFIGASHPSAYRKPDGSNLPIFSVPVEQELSNNRIDFALHGEWQTSETFKLNWRSYVSRYHKNETITALPWQDLGYSSQAASAALSGNGTVRTLVHELNGTWQPVAGHVLLSGIEQRKETRSAPFFNARGIESSKEYRIRSVFSQYEWTATQRLKLLGGLRYDDLSTSDSAPSGNLGLNYEFSPLARLRASIAQGFRAPDLPETFVDRLTPKGRIMGSDVVNASLGKTAFELKPERSRNVEIGLTGLGQNWNYDLALYWNRVKDRIEQGVENPKGIAYRTFRNISSARLRGLDAQFGYRFNAALALQADVGLLEAENQQTGQRLEFTPQHQAGLTLNWRPTSEWQTKLILRHVGNQFYIDTRSGAPIPSTANGYTFVNVKASYFPSALSNTELYAGIDNLLDAAVDPILGSSVGPYAYFGLRHYF
jgi:outer membrane receptor for ferrienterochelin and colicins